MIHDMVHHKSLPNHSNKSRNIYAWHLFESSEATWDSVTTVIYSLIFILFRTTGSSTQKENPSWNSPQNKITCMLFEELSVPKNPSCDPRFDTFQKNLQKMTFAQTRISVAGFSECEEN